jgi:hypothetical protein
MDHPRLVGHLDDRLQLPRAVQRLEAAIRVWQHKGLINVGQFVERYDRGNGGVRQIADHPKFFGPGVAVNSDSGEGVPVGMAGRNVQAANTNAARKPATRLRDILNYQSNLRIPYGAGQSIQWIGWLPAWSNPYPKGKSGASQPVLPAELFALMGSWALERGHE